MTDKYNMLHNAFLSSDRDGDGYLNEGEFLSFCEAGLGKQADGRMYQALCGQVGADPSVGATWDNLSTMFAASNPHRQPSPSPQPQSPPQVVEQPVLSPNLTSPHSSHKRNSSVSSFTSQDDVLRSHSIPRGHSRAESVASLDDFDDDLSQTSEGPRISGLGGGHYRAQSSIADMELIKALQGGNEAAQKKLSKKIKHLTKKLASAEKSKKRARDEAEQIQQRLAAMQDNLSRLERDKSQLVEKNRELQDTTERLRRKQGEQENEIRSLNRQHDEDARTIADLETQRNEVLILFKNAEAQFEGKLAAVKRKHKEQLQKVSTGFVESLGAQPGEDVGAMVSELREEKRKLSNQVDTLAEQLTRKDRSLQEALIAVDALTTQHKKNNMPQVDGVGVHARRPSLLSRRFSLRNVAQYAMSRRSRTIEPEQEDSEERSMSRQASMPSALGTISARKNNSHRPLDFSSDRVGHYQADPDMESVGSGFIAVGGVLPTDDNSPS